MAVFYSDNLIVQCIMLSLLVHQYCVFMVVFLLDKVAIRYLERHNVLSSIAPGQYLKRYWLLQKLKKTANTGA